jgi:peptidoglycan-associated lipoprotein
MTLRIAFSRWLPLAAVLTALSACTSTSMDDAKPEAVAVYSGQTNDPAPGFENVKPGTEQDFILNVGRRIYFTSGSAALDSVAKATLDKQAAWLQANPRWLVKVQGFSDDPGGESKNVALSKQRGDAVMAYLAAAGVASNRMWVRAYGNAREVRECSERACVVQNRRVVVNLRTERDDT